MEAWLLGDHCSCVLVNPTLEEVIAVDPIGSPTSQPELSVWKALGIFQELLGLAKCRDIVEIEDCRGVFSTDQGFDFAVDQDAESMEGDCIGSRDREG